MSTPDKRAALLELARAQSRLEELRLRVLAGAEDVAVDAAARDAAAWLAHHAEALAGGRANRDQAEAVVAALEDLPDDLDPAIVDRAEQEMVRLVDEHDPRRLRILGRRLLHVVAPDLAEEAERLALEKEERQAARLTHLTTRRNGDGTTLLKARLADAVVERLMTFLHAFTSPRRTGRRAGQGGDDRRPHDQVLGHAFGAFLEAADPQRMPLHGGAATTVVVTIDLADLRGGTGVGLVGDELISAGQVRRLACTAHILPMVLGGKSEILDLGRHRRLFSPAQRKAMAVRDVHCRAEGCDIPAAWCEAHHAAAPWIAGGRTDLGDGVLLCSWHHHRAHDHRYDTRHHPDGTLRFHRRT